MIRLIKVYLLMDYQVLARKWRPRSFKEMVGQETILRILMNALTQQRIHHAYLLTGTRGVGKTTLARIFAKCLNCESGITPEPCNQCATCKAIDAGQFLDLFEVDAASRTRVEDTRELLDNILYPPTQGRFKVYLIDEVHMLSNHSFNALLKTLEEPPAHVKFLLATTDPKRLPITVLSRCLQFHLKRILPQQITQHLQHICKSENIAYELTGLEKLAQAADGSMRDALSLLDQAIAYGQGQVALSDIHTMLGCIATDNLFALLEALAAKNGQQLFKLIAQLIELAPDFSQVLEELIHLFHQMALLQIVPDAITTDAALVSLAKRVTPEDVQLYYQIALLGRRDLAFAPNPQQGFEMVMLRMLAFHPASVSQPQQIEEAPAITIITEKIKVEAIKAIAPEPIKQDIPINVNPISIDWRQILPQLELSGMAYALASNCTLKNMIDNKIELTLSASHQPLLNQKLKDRILEGLNRHFKREMQLEIHITTDEIMTPVKQQQQERTAHLTKTRETVLQHPTVQKLVEMYDATVDVTLVQ